MTTRSRSTIVLSASTMEEWGSPRMSRETRASSVTRRIPLSPAVPRVGDRIGHYLLKRIISSGGMGTVYEAIQEAPKRTVAVKVMKPTMVSRSALRL